MTYIIAAIAIAALIYLSQRKSKPVKQVSLYGDSITSGASYTDAGVMVKLSPSPVQVISSLSGTHGVDYSLPGATVIDATNGAPDLPFKTFSEQIAKDPSSVIVIRYATASGLKMIGQLEQYKTLLVDMVAQAKALGKTVLLTGSPVIEQTIRGESPERVAALIASVDEFESATNTVAVQHNVPFINLRGLEFHPGDTVDGVHPARAYSDRLSAEIARYL